MTEPKTPTPPRTPVDDVMDEFYGVLPLPATTRGPRSEEPLNLDPNVRERERDLDRVMMLYTTNQGTMSPDERAARWVHGSDWKPGMKVEGEGINGFALRGYLSLYGDNFDERQAIFQRVYPDGGYEEVPDTDIVLYRKNPDEPWRKADPGFFETWGKDYFWKEFRMDIYDFTGELPVILGEAAAALSRRGAPKAGASGQGAAASAITGAFRNMFRFAFGAALGHGAKQAAQYKEGTQLETPWEQAGGAFEESLMSAGGTGAGWLLGGTVGVVRRRAVLKELRPGARRAMKSAEEHQYPTIPLPQLTDAPFIVRWGRQGAAVWKTLARQSRAVEQHSRKLLDKLIDPKARSNFLGKMEELAEKENRLIREMTQRAVHYLHRHPSERGLIVSEKLTHWWDTSSKNAVDAAANTARAILEPTFDLRGSTALDYARMLKKGVTTPDMPTTTMNGTGLFDEFGEEIMEEVTEAEMRRISALNADLEKLVDDILAIDPEFPSVTPQGEITEYSATDRIREFIKRAHDIAMPEPGGGLREPQLKAMGLARELKEVLRNPVEENPEFREAWDTFLNMAQDRFATREYLGRIDAIRTSTPAQLVDTLTGNEYATIDHLIAVRKAGGEEVFEELQSEFMWKLFDAERQVRGGMEQVVRKTNPHIYDMLVPKAHQKALAHAASEFQKLHSTGIETALRRQTQIRPFIEEIVDNDKSAGIDALWGIVEKHGGKDGEFGVTLRAAILDTIIDRASVQGKPGGLPGEVAGGAQISDVAGRAAESLGEFNRVSGEKLAKTIKDFKERGLLKFLKRSDLKTINDVEAVQKLMDAAGMDAGTSLLGAEVVSGVSQFKAQAISRMIHLLGTSRILTNPLAVRLMTGPARGRDPRYIDTYGLQAIGAMIGSLATDVGEGAEVPEFGRLLEARERQYETSEPAP